MKLVVQLEAANFAPDEFMKETFSIDRRSLLPEESRCSRKQLINALKLAKQRKADQS